MDSAQRYVEAYGSIRISLPLISKLTNNFQFDLLRGSSNYYNDAKTQVQGAEASFQQTIQSFGAGVRGQMDPTVAAAYATQLQNYFANLSRYQTKQNLLDQAAQQQLQANLAAANTNIDPAVRAAAAANALQAYGQQYAAPSNPPVYPTADQFDANLPGPARTWQTGRPSRMY